MTTNLSLFTAEDITRELPELARLLHDCVHAGASIGFIMPHSMEDAEAFWRDKVAGPLASSTRLLLVAKDGARIAGAVQLDYDTPANQPHRAEIRKLLVHPDFRRRGIAKKLMTAIEDEARRLRRSLLTLDTRTGDTAEPLYAAIGYHTTGVIPGYCRDTHKDRLDSTTIMYKNL